MDSLLATLGRSRFVRVFVLFLFATIVNGASSSCADGLIGSFETDVDCGGECMPCETGKFCKLNADCESNVCEGFVCIDFLARRQRSLQAGETSALGSTEEPETGFGSATGSAFDDTEEPDSTPVGSSSTIYFPSEGCAADSLEFSDLASAGCNVQNTAVQSPSCCEFLQDWADAECAEDVYSEILANHPQQASTFEGVFDACDVVFGSETLAYTTSAVTSDPTSTTMPTTSAPTTSMPTTTLPTTSAQPTGAPSTSITSLPTTNLPSSDISTTSVPSAYSTSTGCGEPSLNVSTLLAAGCNLFNPTVQSEACCSYLQVWAGDQCASQHYQNILELYPSEAVAIEAMFDTCEVVFYVTGTATVPETMSTVSTSMSSSAPSSPPTGSAFDGCTEPDSTMNTGEIVSAGCAFGTTEQPDSCCAYFEDFAEGPCADEAYTNFVSDPANSVYIPLVETSLDSCGIELDLMFSNESTADSTTTGADESSVPSLPSSETITCGIDLAAITDAGCNLFSGSVQSESCCSYLEEWAALPCAAEDYEEFLDDYSAYEELINELLDGCGVSIDLETLTIEETETITVTETELTETMSTSESSIISSSPPTSTLSSATPTPDCSEADIDYTDIVFAGCNLFNPYSQPQTCCDFLQEALGGPCGESAYNDLLAEYSTYESIFEAVLTSCGIVVGGPPSSAIGSSSSDYGESSVDDSEYSVTLISDSSSSTVDETDTEYPITIITDSSTGSAVEPSSSTSTSTSTSASTSTSTSASTSTSTFSSSSSTSTSSTVAWSYSGSGFGSGFGVGSASGSSMAFGSAFSFPSPIDSSDFSHVGSGTGPALTIDESTSIDSSEESTDSIGTGSDLTESESSMYSTSSVAASSSLSASASESPSLTPSESQSQPDSSTGHLSSPASESLSRSPSATESPSLSATTSAVPTTATATVTAILSTNELSCRASSLHTQDCSGHGICEDDGTCTCLVGWSGEYCETQSFCPLNDQGLQCSGNGYCDVDTCVCADGYSGDDCELLTCPSDCSGNGSPYVESDGVDGCDGSTGVCSCFSSWETVDTSTLWVGFTGEDCAMPRCDSLYQTADCSGNGNCDSSIGECTCKSVDGVVLFIGSACHVENSEAIATGETVETVVTYMMTDLSEEQFSDPDVYLALQRGYAQPLGLHTDNIELRLVQLRRADQTQQLEAKIVFVTNSTATSTGGSSGGGFTSAAALASFLVNNAATMGQSIETTLATDAGVTVTVDTSAIVVEIPCPGDCSGNGVCDRTSGVCTCNEGWSGDPSCKLPDCFGSASIDEQCSGNGQCQEPDVCTCVSGYIGTECETLEANATPTTEVGAETGGDDGGDDALNGGIIAGIVVGGLAVCVGAVGFFLYRRSHGRVVISPGGLFEEGGQWDGFPTMNSNPFGRETTLQGSGAAQRQDFGYGYGNGPQSDEPPPF